jgi:hypothetical protein
MSTYVCVWNNTKNTKYKTRNDRQITHRTVIAASMFMYGNENRALNRYERRKIEPAEIRFFKHASGYALRNHVCNTAVRNALVHCDM